MEGHSKGQSIKSVIAKLNANILPHKKHCSPPKSVKMHSNSPKSPKSPRNSYSAKNKNQSGNKSGGIKNVYDDKSGCSIAGNSGNLNTKERQERHLLLEGLDSNSYSNSRADRIDRTTTFEAYKDIPKCPIGGIPTNRF